MKLQFLAEEGTEDTTPKKSHERTVTSLAKRMVARCRKDFNGKDELTSAKRMARNFHQRLVDAIEKEYEKDDSESEEVSEKEVDISFSLTEALKYETD